MHYFLKVIQNYFQFSSVFLKIINEISHVLEISSLLPAVAKFVGLYIS